MSSLDPTALAALQLASLSGEPAVCFYWKVIWDANDSAQTRYYSDACYQEMVPFTGVGVVMEARILGSLVKDTAFEINPDLRTSNIKLSIDDIDKTISGKFKTFGSGVRCELVVYYQMAPTSITYSVWFGQLQAPAIYGWKTLECEATNGFRSREQLIPSRTRPIECTSNFGGQLTAEASVTAICPYQKQNGGLGNYITGTTPYAACPRLTEADCIARLGALSNGKAKFFGGFQTVASAVVNVWHGHPSLAVSEGNDSKLSEPIRVIAGKKHVRDLQMLQWRRRTPAGIAHGWVDYIFELGEGPIRAAYNMVVGAKTIENVYQQFQLGDRGQDHLAYAGDVSNYSGTAVCWVQYGWIDAGTIDATNLPQGECDIEGYANVAVHNDVTPNSNQGLLGLYTDIPTGATAYRIDYNLNFSQTYGIPPIAGFDGTNFTATWTGQIKPLYSETYTFTGQHYLGMTLTVNGVVVFDNAAAGTDTGTIALTANTLYTIQVDFTQTPTNLFKPWKCILQWQSASQALEVVPNSRLFNTGAPVASNGRQWSDDRVWWLLELYTNQRWGMAYPSSRFNIPDWTTAATWGLQTVGFSVTYPDGETESFPHRRTSFNVILEGRPAAEQIEDVCRSGGLSVPFQHEGSFTITPFREATSGELSATRVFTDTGESRNIVWDNGQPSITLSQVANDKVINEVELTFEDESNGGAARPITVDDKDQKLLAGRELGGNNLKSVPKKFAGFGIVTLAEAIKTAYRFLYFGDFDSGGTKNNLTVTILTPFEQALGIKRYDVIKVVSALVTGFLSPTGVQFQYFRVLSLNKVANGRCQIVAQAYNSAAYTAFETTTLAIPDLHPLPAAAAITPPPKALAIAATHDAANGNLNVTIS